MHATVLRRIQVQFEFKLSIYVAFFHASVLDYYLKHDQAAAAEYVRSLNKKQRDDMEDDDIDVQDSDSVVVIDVFHELLFSVYCFNPLQNDHCKRFSARQFGLLIVSFFSLLKNGRDINVCQLIMFVNSVFQ